LEFFAWGLLAIPTLDVLTDTFHNETFLLNGIVQGLKGLLSFLFAPIIGAFSDVKGRKPFLLLTVAVTCMPIPLLTIQPWWFFSLLALSGTCAVTFTIVFAYVSDITEKEERNSAYGLVSAMFAASLVLSPAVGVYLSKLIGIDGVVLIATFIAFLDIMFILVWTPESRHFSKVDNDSETDNLFEDQSTPVLNTEEVLMVAKQQISWDQVDPFKALRSISHDRTLWMISLAVFLSYLPESGQYTNFPVYLDKVLSFEDTEIAMYIAWVGILAVVVQALILPFLTEFIGQRHTILFGLACQGFELVVFTFATEHFWIWITGFPLSLSSLVFPAMSTWCSLICDQEKQGVIQGIITGIRGLCQGLGPAIYGLLFHLFRVPLDDVNGSSPQNEPIIATEVMPGPPFIFAAIFVMCSILVVMVINSPIERGNYTLASSESSSNIKIEPLNRILSDRDMSHQRYKVQDVTIT